MSYLSTLGILFLAVGIVLTVIGGLQLFSKTFYKWMTQKLFKQRAKIMTEEQFYFYHRFIHGGRLLLVGIILLGLSCLWLFQG